MRWSHTTYVIGTNISMEGKKIEHNEHNIEKNQLILYLNYMFIKS